MSSCCANGACSKTKGAEVVPLTEEKDCCESKSCASKQDTESKLLKPCCSSSDSCCKSKREETKSAGACCSEGHCKKTPENEIPSAGEKDCCKNGDFVSKQFKEVEPAKLCCSSCDGCCKSNQKETKSAGTCCSKGKCSKRPENERSNNNQCCESRTEICSGDSKDYDLESSCCANHQHPLHDAPSSQLCLAVIRENGTDVVVFDARGLPRTFHYSASGGVVKPLCFSSHGAGKTMDDLLTPCFDEDGNHGIPEESCFCGVDTPHLHAHLRDPKTCGSGEDVGVKNVTSDRIGYLASQILHPIAEGDQGIAFDVENAPMEQALPIFKVSESMPKQCNSKELLEHKKSLGANAVRRAQRRLHRVKHDDHIDYLVHNSATGELHLEHPCNSCGEDDVHGNFRSVGKRRLQRSSSNGDIQVQFFEVATRPFNIKHFLFDMFECNSDRVNAVENILETGKASRRNSRKASSIYQETLEDRSGGYQKIPNVSPTTEKQTSIVRSTVKCNGICCSSEVPIIRKLVEPIDGVKKLMVNVPLKQVMVDHDPSIVSIAKIADVLNREKMGASVQRDGAATMELEAALPTKSNEGRSQLYVQNICCASEIPAINRILRPMEGVKDISINTTTKMVYVDHELSLVSAKGLADALNDQGFGADIRHDAAQATSAPSRLLFVRSTLAFKYNGSSNDAVTTEALTMFLKSFDPKHQIETFIVDVPDRTISVVHNPFTLTSQSIAKMLKEATDIDAEVTVDGADPAMWNFSDAIEGAMDAETEDFMNNEEEFTYPRLTVIISGVLWIVSMLSYIGGNWEYLKYVALASVAFGIPPIALKAFRTLQRYQFDTNCLMFFASCGAVALQDYTEAAAVVFLFALSEWLEVRATTRARHALSSIVQLRPEKANLIHPITHELIVVPASAVPVGALVSVKTGDKIPCDGVVVEGRSTVDESSLTGESRPIRKGPDDPVSGGTVNSGLSPLTIRTKSTSENSAVSRLIRLVEEAQTNRSETEKLVDEFARLYTPVVVLAALLMCSIPWAFGSEAGRKWTENGLILIVVACPCALIISTPVSYVAGLAATAQKGVLIKGGATLEALGQTKHVCFDKTGTLTNGEFALLHMNVLTTSLSRVEVFQRLSLMEERASHPVAQAILLAARNEGVTIPKNMNLESHNIINGEGVTGVINGLEVYVGNERLFSRLGLLQSVPLSDIKTVETWKLNGGTVGFMSVEGHGIVCCFCASDGIRNETVDVVRSLKSIGISITMLTGDNTDAAETIGRQIGLTSEEIKSKLLPEEKLKFIESLAEGQKNQSVIWSLFSKKELVMMCGDGVNDAPALAASDVGVAMGAGAALSMETADVTLLDSNLEKIEYSIRMGRRVTRKIVENVVFSLVVKIVVLCFALAGMTQLWAAIASDVGAMLLVTMNAMMLLPRRQTKSDVANLQGDIEEAQTHHTGLARQISPSNEPLKSSNCEQNCCGSREQQRKSSHGDASLHQETHINSCDNHCCSAPPKDGNHHGNCSSNPHGSSATHEHEMCKSHNNCCSSSREHGKKHTTLHAHGSSAISDKNDHCHTHSHGPHDRGHTHSHGSHCRSDASHQHEHEHSHLTSGAKEVSEMHDHGYKTCKNEQTHVRNCCKSKEKANGDSHDHSHSHNCFDPNEKFA